LTDGKDRDRVVLFVDFDHLSRKTELARRPVCSLSGALEIIMCRVQELGDVVAANVYADWGQHSGLQSEIKRLHLDPRVVYSEPRSTHFSAARGNGALVTLALDALQMLFERSEVNTYVFVGGSCALLDLTGRLRGHGKKVMVIGFEKDVHPDLRDGTVTFEPLESHLPPMETDRGDTPPSPDAYEAPQGSGIDWKPFVLLLNRLEGHLPFVSLKYLKNQVLTSAHGCDDTLESKGNLIREAIRLRYVETSKIPNPRNPQFATTACRLNRKHADVRRILGL
jgi:hypothetical protein